MPDGGRGRLDGSTPARAIPPHSSTSSSGSISRTSRPSPSSGASARRRTRSSPTRAGNHGHGGDASAAPGASPQARRVRRARRDRAARHAREPASLPEEPAAQPPRPRALADGPDEPARRARRGESHLAHALRPRASSRRRRTLAARASCPPIPQLLDWLAGKFMDDGWDVKALHRLIVSSETFRQSSQAAPATAHVATRTTSCSPAARRPG